MSKLFRGTYTAVITPFTDDNQIDWVALSNIIEMQIAGGIEGILFVGTTGESPTLSYSEHYEILHRSVKMVNGRCQVIHGTGSNNTEETIKSSKIANEAGADAQLIINPYYNKPTQEGLYKHFTTVADQTDVPIIVYNIESRTGVNLETDTLLRIAEHKNIVGVKEASGNIGQMLDVIRFAPDDFSVLVGDDALALPFIASGGDGVVSVVSNCLPKTFSDIVRRLLKGDITGTQKDFYNILDIIHSIFIESNPIPMKEIMSLLGYCKPHIRLPLCRASEASMKKIKETVELIKTLEQ